MRFSSAASAILSQNLLLANSPTSASAVVWQKAHQQLQQSTFQQHQFQNEKGLLDAENQVVKQQLLPRQNKRVQRNRRWERRRRLSNRPLVPSNVLLANEEQNHVPHTTERDVQEVVMCTNADTGILMECNPGEACVDGKCEEVVRITTSMNSTAADTFCNPYSEDFDDEFGPDGPFDCDCSATLKETGIGTLTCTYENYCMNDEENFCGVINLFADFDGTAEFTYQYCYDFETPYPYLYCISSNSQQSECTITINGDDCNSCMTSMMYDETCDDPEGYFFSTFDCTNIISLFGGDSRGGNKGDACVGDYASDFIAKGFVQTSSTCVDNDNWTFTNPNGNARSCADVRNLGENARQRRCTDNAGIRENCQATCESWFACTTSTTIAPTIAPTPQPTPSPTENPTTIPTNEPTQAPTENPTPDPTPDPTSDPTHRPTPFPTRPNVTFDAGTKESTRPPTMQPTESPSRPVSFFVFVSVCGLVEYSITH